MTTHDELGISTRPHVNHTLAHGRLVSLKNKNWCVEEVTAILFVTYCRYRPIESTIRYKALMKIAARTAIEAIKEHESDFPQMVSYMSL